MAENNVSHVSTSPSAEISSSEGMSTKRTENSKQAINKLPPELLSRIFAIGDKEKRSQRILYQGYCGIQDLALQICSYWRDVAINDPSLWTYIYISRTPPLPHALLYLKRSKTSNRLIIDVELRRHYLASISNSDGPLGDVGGIFNYLFIHGATADRWESLMLCARRLDLVFELVQSLYTLSPPALRFLSLRRENLPDFRADIEAWSTDNQPLPDAPMLASNLQMPCLCNAEFDGLPSVYLFGQPKSLVTGLVHLTLCPEAGQHSISTLHKVLSSNDQLESLTLRGTFVPTDPETSTLCVYLPALRAFTLDLPTNTSWALAIMRTVNSPFLEHLTLVQHGGEFSTETIQYIITGSFNDRSHNSAQAAENRKPVAPSCIYPNLKTLNIQRLTIKDLPMFRAMLAAFHTVTRVSLPPGTLHLLGVVPCIMPSLTCIDHDSPEELDVLVNVLNYRAVAGFPVKQIQVRRELPSKLRDGLPNSVDVVNYQNLPTTSLLAPPLVPIRLLDSNDNCCCC